VTGILTSRACIGASSCRLLIVSIYIVAGSDAKYRAVAAGILVLAFARLNLLLAHLPLFQGSESQILSQENIESSIYIAEGIISNENNITETPKDLTDLRGRVPSVVATCPT